MDIPFLAAESPPNHLHCFLCLGPRRQPPEEEPAFSKGEGGWPVNVFWLQHLGKLPQTRARPSAGTCWEPLWRRGLEPLASRMEPTERERSEEHLRPFRFLHSFSISHTLFS